MPTAAHNCSGIRPGPSYCNFTVCHIVKTSKCTVTMGVAMSSRSVSSRAMSISDAVMLPVMRRGLGVGDGITDPTAIVEAIDGQIEWLEYLSRVTQVGGGMGVAATAAGPVMAVGTAISVPAARMVTAMLQPSEGTFEADGGNPVPRSLEAVLVYLKAAAVGTVLTQAAVTAAVAALTAATSVLSYAGAMSPEAVNEQQSSDPYNFTAFIAAAVATIGVGGITLMINHLRNFKRVLALEGNMQVAPTYYGNEDNVRIMSDNNPELAERVAGGRIHDLPTVQAMRDAQLLITIHLHKVYGTDRSKPFLFFLYVRIKNDEDALKCLKEGVKAGHLQFDPHGLEALVEMQAPIDIIIAYLDKTKGWEALRKSEYKPFVNDECMRSLIMRDLAAVHCLKIGNKKALFDSILHTQHTGEIYSQYFSNLHRNAIYLEVKQGFENKSSPLLAQYMKALDDEARKYSETPAIIIFNNIIKAFGLNLSDKQKRAAFGQFRTALADFLRSNGYDLSLLKAQAALSQNITRVASGHQGQYAINDLNAAAFATLINEAADVRAAPGARRP